jgi:hypothetical protein
MLAPPRRRGCATGEQEAQPVVTEEGVPLVEREVGREAVRGAANATADAIVVFNIPWRPSHGWARQAR